MSADAKFTPGPWEAADPHDDPNDMGVATEIRSETRDEIALVPIDDTDVDATAETEANARLISAGPDLYAACKASIECRDDALDLMQAAIAKAEGDNS